MTAGFSESKVNRLFANLEKQVRFAAAQALTKTAQDAQAEVRRQLPERFTIRTGWLAKGIRVRAANKTDLKATVSVLDQFMALQETGGIKEKQNHAMAVPIGARPSLRGTTPRSKWPSSLLRKKGYFIAPITEKSLTARSQTKSNYRRRIHNKPNVVFNEKTSRIESSDVGSMALWHRRGRKRLPIDLIYVFKDKVYVDPRFDFRKTVIQVARKRFSKRFADKKKKNLRRSWMHRRSAKRLWQGGENSAHRWKTGHLACIAQWLLNWKLTNEKCALFWTALSVSC